MDLHVCLSERKLCIVRRWQCNVEPWSALTSPRVLHVLLCSSNLSGCQLSIAESSESVAEDWIILLCSLLDPDETLEQDVGLGQWVMGQVGAVSQGQYKVTGLDTGLFMEEDIWTVITDSLSPPRTEPAFYIVDSEWFENNMLAQLLTAIWPR